MIRAVRWCISALLLLLAWQVHADARNVIVFFINGANQAGLEFARAAGADFAGLSNLSAFPVRGTLLPLTGEYRPMRWRSGSRPTMRSAHFRPEKSSIRLRRL